MAISRAGTLSKLCTAVLSLSSSIEDIAMVWMGRLWWCTKLHLELWGQRCRRHRVPCVQIGERG